MWKESSPQMRWRLQVAENMSQEVVRIVVGCVAGSRVGLDMIAVLILRASRAVVKDHNLIYTKDSSTACYCGCKCGFCIVCLSAVDSLDMVVRREWKSELGYNATWDSYTDCVVSSARWFEDCTRPGCFHAFRG